LLIAVSFLLLLSVTVNPLTLQRLAHKLGTYFKQEFELYKVERIPSQVRQAHELSGMIALAEKDYDRAITELQQANQQNPQNLYRLCQAYQGKGDNAKAKEFCSKAAGFNSLPQLNYAFIRAKAQKMAV
jgi:tetratricopeptide (TPR) repeat protein